MITPATPIKQLRRTVLRTYWIQTMAVVCPAMVLSLLLNAGDVWLAAVLAFCAAACAISAFAAWNSAIKARQSLIKLIAIKRQMEKP